MSERLEQMSLDQLQARLADLASVIEFPSTPDLGIAVGSRLRVASGDLRARRRLLPTPSGLRRSLLLAATLALLIAGAALAVRFGLELLSITPGLVPTPPTGHPSLDLGTPVSLQVADSQAAFEIATPDALGTPDAVYLGGDTLRGQVAFVYAPRADLPASNLIGGAGLLITQNEGRPDPGLADKIVDTSRASVERVEIDGTPGLWISGEPHLFWYLAPDGTYINESRRVVGDTLAWERNGILYRIEGALSLSQAREIASSMR